MRRIRASCARLNSADVKCPGRHGRYLHDSGRPARRARGSNRACHQAGNRRGAAQPRTRASGDRSATEPWVRSPPSGPCYPWRGWAGWAKNPFVRGSRCPPPSRSPRGSRSVPEPTQAKPTGQCVGLGEGRGSAQRQDRQRREENFFIFGNPIRDRERWTPGLTAHTLKHIEFIF